eukprot:Gb_29087 [translate_table: standard]
MDKRLQKVDKPLLLYDNRLLFFDRRTSSVGNNHDNRNCVSLTTPSFVAPLLVQLQISSILFGHFLCVCDVFCNSILGSTCVGISSTTRLSAFVLHLRSSTSHESHF